MSPDSCTTEPARRTAGPAAIGAGGTIAAVTSSGVIVAVSGMPSLNGLPPLRKARSPVCRKRDALTSAKKRSSITPGRRRRKTESRSSRTRRRSIDGGERLLRCHANAESRVRARPAPRGDAHRGRPPERDPLHFASPNPRSAARRRRRVPNRTCCRGPGVRVDGGLLEDLLDGRRSVTPAASHRRDPGDRGGRPSTCRCSRCSRRRRNLGARYRDGGSRNVSVR